MATQPSSRQSAREVCETLLKTVRANKVEKNILPSEVQVIDRLLGRGLELDEAYEELYKKLHEHPNALWSFFDLLQNVAAFSSPEANLEARKGRAKLIDVNRQIEVKARDLATLLTERDELDNYSGFSCNTHYHPVDLIHAAAERNYSYQQWVKNRLESIRGQFDLKYWPSLSSVVQAIADDADRARPQSHDPITDAGTESSRASLADSFKSFFVALAESSERNHGFIPNTFEVTDRSMANLMSCALGLDPNELVDSSYVKRLRQRQRKRVHQT